MQHPDRLQKPNRLKLMVTLTVLSAVLLFAFLIDRFPGECDRSTPTPVPQAQAAEIHKAEAPSSKEEHPRNEVIVYVTSWCPACKMTREYLKEKKIPFILKDVEKNEKYMKEMVRKVGGYRGVPVLDINGRILLGFNPQVLDRLTK